MKIFFSCRFVLAGCLALLSSVCLAQKQGLPAPQSKAPVVYVSDFDFNVPRQSSEQEASRGLLGGVLHGGLLRRHEDPLAAAMEMNTLMADTLVKDLKKAGIDARRAVAGVELPKDGWHVHGMYLFVDPGNVARRTMIGFGAGRSSVQVAVAVDDLASPGESLRQDVTTGHGGRMPGAILALNPYAIAAKVVLAGGDQHKAVKDAAKQIADIVVQRVKAKAPDPASVLATP